jgi:predicted Fe-S protein YdhL (DUF1289 family)
MSALDSEEEKSVWVNETPAEMDNVVWSNGITIDPRWEHVSKVHRIDNIVFAGVPFKEVGLGRSTLRLEEMAIKKQMEKNGVTYMSRFPPLHPFADLPIVKLKSIRGNEISLVAGENIYRYQPIGMYCGEVLGTNTSEYRKRVERKRTAYMASGKNGNVIDAKTVGSVVRYADHACGSGANCMLTLIENDVWILATKDIPKGRLITFDYGWEVRNPQTFFPTPCFCNTEFCRGCIESTISVLKWLRTLSNEDRVNVIMQWDKLREQNPNIKELRAVHNYHDEKTKAIADERKKRDALLMRRAKGLEPRQGELDSNARRHGYF